MNQLPQLVCQDVQLPKIGEICNHIAFKLWPFDIREEASIYLLNL
jgi:hypothetical protein